MGIICNGWQFNCVADDVDDPDNDDGKVRRDEEDRTRKKQKSRSQESLKIKGYLSRLSFPVL